MRRFLELYRETPAPELPAAQFRTLAGDTVVDALLRARILESVAPSRRYACEWPELGCSRRILKNCRNDAFPFIAICGLELPSCRDVLLQRDDAEEYRVVPDRLHLELRALLGLTGTYAGIERDQSGAVYLGELQRTSETLDVFLALARSRPGLRALLAERMLMARRSIVIAPTATNVPREWIERYSPSNHVALAFLSDIVAVVDQKLVLLQSLGEFVTSHREQTAGFCVAFSNSGSRAISATEYEESVHRIGEFDLFIDAVQPKERGLFVGSRRHPDGRVEGARLTRREVEALTELVERKGIAIRARDVLALKDGSARSAVRVLEGARKRIDVLQSARYDWRAFPTIPGDQAGAQRYMFRSGPDLRYLVLVPMRR